MSRRNGRVPWSEVERRAREVYGVNGFRPGQAELIRAVMNGESCLGLLPTGAGKSLTFQLPALFLPKAVLVVSPLIALMQDQQEKLDAKGVAAAHLNSSLSRAEEREVEKEIRQGKERLIYVTPERLENPEYRRLIKQRGVSLLVVDEAHCVSQWGHDFRPAYLSLREAARDLGSPPILALTATATPEVAADLLKQLGVPDARVIETGIERDNLFLEVNAVPREGERDERLLALLTEARTEPSIVYVATVREATAVHQKLRAAGIDAGLYHAKLTVREREEAQHGFMSGGIPVMVATQAFGMGIDKPDLRRVIHYNFPDSLERYYQEVGRAGRDGRSATATLLYRLEDKRIQSFFLGGKYPSRAESSAMLAQFRRLLGENPEGVSASTLVRTVDGGERRGRVLLAHLEGAGILRRGRRGLRAVRDFESAGALESFLEEYEGRHVTDRQRLETMMHYAQSPRCRFQLLREYFGEPEGASCGHCDNCREGMGISKDDAATGKPPEAESERLATLMASVTGERKASSASQS